MGIKPGPRLLTSSIVNKSTRSPRAMSSDPVLRRADLLQFMWVCILMNVTLLPDHDEAANIEKVTGEQSQGLLQVFSHRVNKINKGCPGIALPFLWS